MLKELEENISFKIKERKAKHRELINTIKHAYFDLISIVIKYYTISSNIKLFLVSLEILQLLSYPFDTHFEFLWENTSLYRFFNTLLTYTRVTSIIKGSTEMYLITFYSTILLIIIIVALTCVMTYKMQKSSFPSITCVRILAIAFPLMANSFYIPILNILISIYHCSNNINEYGNNMKCWNVAYVIHSIVGGIALIFFLILVYLIVNTFFEMKNNKNSPLAKREVYTDNVIAFIKTFTCISCSFVTGYNAIRIISIINLALYIYLSRRLFLNTNIYYSFKVQQVYTISSFLTMWGFFSLAVASIATSKKDTIANNLFIYVFIVGAVVIVIGIFVQDKKVRYENMTRPISNAKSPNEVIELIEEIMYLTLNKDENRNYQIKLNGYIQYITASSMLSASSDDIMTKYFDNDDKKGYIYLFLQINKVYQYAISRFPYSAALRIHYAIFLNDYLSRKDQAMIELTDATRYHLTFSEEFIVYQLSKNFENAISSQSLNAVDVFTTMSYKGMSKKFKSLINKISLLYVDFWSLLSSSDHESAEELSRLNNIGTKINDMVESVQSIFKKMQKIRPYDVEIISEYAMFTSEILNDKKTSDEYKSQLMDLGNETKSTIDESNLCHLDLNTVVSSDEYQCVIYSAMAENLGTITHISLSLCGMLGYSKDEILGKSIELILPESFEKAHRKYLRKISNEYKKKFLNDYNEYINFDIKFKEMNIFLRNKSKYLIPTHVKFAFFPSENNTQYFITRVINEGNNGNFNANQYSCYILTNSHLVIQNFSSNAINFLGLASNSINTSKEITENIKQFNEDYLRYLVDIESEEENEVKNSKRLSLQNTVVNNSNLLSSRNKKNNDYDSLERKLNLKHEIIRKKYSSPTPITWIKTQSMNNSMISEGVNNLTVNQKRKGNIDENFILTVNEIREYDEFLGFIFKFECLWYFNLKEKNSFNVSMRDISSPSSTNMVKQKTRNTLLPDDNILFSPGNPTTMRKELIGESSLHLSTKNIAVGDKKIDKNFIPDIGKKFTINATSIAFVQHDKTIDENKLRNELRKQAENKISALNKENSSLSSSDDEEEDESYESSENSSDSNSNYISSTSSEEERKKRKKTNNSMNNDNNNGYYHVDLTKIKLYVYEYKKNVIVENVPQGGNKSQIEIKLKEDSGNNPKKDSDTSQSVDASSGNSNDKITSTQSKKKKKDDSVSSTLISQEEILKKEIENALKRNDSSKSITLLYILSFISLGMLFVKGFIYVFVITNRINVIKNSILLLENSYNIFNDMVMTLYHVRELTLLNIEKYNNYYSDKDSYYQNHSETINEYFMDIDQINSIMLTLPIQLPTNTSLFLDQVSGAMYYLKDDLSITNITTRFKTVISTVNLSLFHILNITYASTYTTNKDIFFFLYNGFNSLYVGLEYQTQYISYLFLNNFNREFISIIIIFVVCELMVFGAYFVVMIAMKEVSVKKNSYLTVFFEIGKRVILKSLAKCEKFSMKYQNENNAAYNSSNVTDVSSNSEDSDLLNDVSINTSANKTNSKQNQPSSHSKKKNRNYSNDVQNANQRYIITLFLVIVSDVVITTLVIIYYKQIKDAITIYEAENTIEKYAILLFNLLREYMFDKNAVFLFDAIGTVLPTIFETVYLIVQTERQKIRNCISKLPSFFYNNYIRINNENICHFSQYEIENYYNDTTCEELSGQSAVLGLDKLLMYFFEDIRYLKGLVYFMAEKSENEKHFKYNYTVYGTKYWDDYIKEGASNMTEYWQYSPIIMFNSDTHKKLSFFLRFLIKPAFNELIKQTTKGIDNDINKIENIIYFGIFCVMGGLLIVFIVLWIPFIKKVNTSIYKTKNMLTIIPRDVLASVWNIQQLLEINTNLDQIAVKNINSSVSMKNERFAKYENKLPN